MSVKEQDGKAEELEQGNGDVRFCGLGILPVTVTVGSGGMCNQEVIRDVPIAWHRTYILRVTYDPEAYHERMPPPEPTCEILFRVRGPMGAPVPEAVVRLDSPVVKSVVADQFGQADIVLKAPSHLAGSANAAGLKPGNFEYDCSPREPEHEEAIILAAHRRRRLSCGTSYRPLYDYSLPCPFPEG